MSGRRPTAARRPGPAAPSAAAAVCGPGVLALLVALLVVLGHVRPAVAYPFSGVALLLGWALVLIESVLMARRAGVSLAGAVPAGVALTTLVAWCWARTAFSTVPADGAETLTTLLEGLAAFWTGAFLVTIVQVGQASCLPSRSSQSNRETDATPVLPGPAAGPVPENPLPLTAGERLLPLLFAVVAAGMALYAITQYHYLYPQRAREERVRAAERKAEGLPDDPVAAGVLYMLESRRVGATFGAPNVLAGFLAVCVPLLAAAPWTVARARRRAMAGACAAAGVALCYAAWRTGSGGGFLVLATALAMTAAGLAVRRRRVGAWLAVCAAVAGFALAQLPAGSRAAAGDAAQGAPSPMAASVSKATTATVSADNAPRAALPGAAGTRVEPAVPAAAARAPFSFLGNLTSKSTTIRERLFYLRTAWRLWLRAPWTGHGLGAYGRLYGQERIPGAGESQYVHDVAAQMAVEAGLLGLAPLAVFVGLLAWRWLGALRTLARGGSPVPAALGASVALFLLDSQGEMTFYDREVLLDACLLAGALCAATAPPLLRPAAASASGACATVAPGCAPSPPASIAPGNLPSRSHLWLATAAAALVAAGLAFVGVPSQMERYWIQTARDAVDEVVAADKAGAAADRAWWADQASRAADRAVWWQPGSPWPYQMRAGVAGMLQHPEQAESDLRYAVSLDPLSARLHSDLADLTLRRRPTPQGMREAMALVDQAVALHPLKSTFHEQRARFLAKQGLHDEALFEAREAVRLAFADDEKASSRETLAGLEHPENQKPR